MHNEDLFIAMRLREFNRGTVSPRYLLVFPLALLVSALYLAALLVTTPEEGLVTPAPEVGYPTDCGHDEEDYYEECTNWVELNDFYR